MKTQVCLLHFILFIAVCTACTNEKQIERLHVEPTILTTHIESMMPGYLSVHNNYIVWEDPFSSNEFLCVLDRGDGHEVGKMLLKGQGPDEFIAPCPGISNNNTVIVADMSQEKLGRYSLDSLKEHKNPIMAPFQKAEQEVMAVVETTQGDIISFLVTEKQPFKIKGKLFGKFPFAVKENYDFQGIIAYHFQKDYLVYSTFKFPYMALYQNEGGELNLIWEKTGNFDYTIKDSTLQVNKKDHGVSGLAATKDYIVTLERDKLTDQTDESTVGRDFTKLPKNLFLYDYKGEVCKILTLPYPILRIAADSNSNEVYLICLKDDFVLAKIDLDQMKLN